MSEKPKTRKVTFRLPNQIIGTVEMIRIIRELEKLDDFLYQANLRAPGTPTKPPKYTKTLDELAELNQISLLKEAERKKLIEVLKKLENEAPTMHISFAVEPSVSFMQKIVDWSREQLHPYIMVNVGLQPSVVVGCEVRTTNKIFDMSLRNRFKETRKILITELEKSNG